MKVVWFIMAVPRHAFTFWAANLIDFLYSLQVLSRLGESNLTFGSWQNLLSWLQSRPPTGHSKILRHSAAQATVYLLWKERNCRFHSSIALAPSQIFRQIDRAIKDTLLARRYRKGGNLLLSEWFTYS
ncbi:unnamed protein product [Microthlaspi erraticum]|uniref:Reverse transcriptase zinc-binding domain-containing protein n=1 Tax=Microthlaspi erraticum TaxID=1685480 RepID=A0A6D2KKC7_9BRAS|nr:unnamed protein product [Microthlaspi erraticum]